ncbi:peptidoglycan DD-metalloendopeptidase family protein [Altererythrobacter sp. BO-6]|uniref:peptidoglycan DD-metalloendopeptidase family protein n=1 Tax=Altererythrobacter sp. BO-6 TaxID=2604537 RepID=UPI0024080ECA|nr:peptidoglycan DD-metalloendopeptidase family protein [Altererythrobacter sp. BO-6]
MHNQLPASGWGERLRRWFPDREFFMRSQGQVRFIKISSRVQMTAAAIVLALLVGWAISMAAMAWTQYRAQADRLSLLEREARVATATERVNAYRDNLEAVTQDLVKRQEFLEQITEAIPADVKSESAVSDSSTEAAATVDKVSAAIPEAAALAQIEARQLAYVERLTRYADRRAERSAQAMRKLGLDPKAMLRRAEQQAMGGPLEILATSANGQVDPRFERLGLSLARMAALEESLDGIPQVNPTSRRMTQVSSGFGYRRDPFTRRGAMHQGLDFKGPIGAPIYSAAKGRVSFVGRKHGYGNVVEVSHGNGVMTRYAHLSRFNAKVGQNVEAGDLIAALGNTGRSTGPHLHFEVRINDRAVNPRPFLETAQNVLKEARGTDAADRGE